MVENNMVAQFREAETARHVEMQTYTTVRPRLLNAESDQFHIRLTHLKTKYSRKCLSL